MDPISSLYPGWNSALSEMRKSGGLNCRIEKNKPEESAAYTENQAKDADKDGEITLAEYLEASTKGTKPPQEVKEFAENLDQIINGINVSNGQLFWSLADASIAPLLLEILGAEKPYEISRKTLRINSLLEKSIDQSNIPLLETQIRNEAKSPALKVDLIEILAKVDFPKAYSLCNELQSILGNQLSSQTQGKIEKKYQAAFTEMIITNSQKGKSAADLINEANINLNSTAMTNNVNVRVGQQVSVKKIDKKEQENINKFEITFVPGKTTAIELSDQLSTAGLPPSIERDRMDEAASNNRVFDKEDIEALDDYAENLVLLEYLRANGIDPKKLKGVFFKSSLKNCLIKLRECPSCLNDLIKLKQNGAEIDAIALEELTLNLTMGSDCRLEHKELIDTLLRLAKSQILPINQKTICLFDAPKAQEDAFLSFLGTLKEEGATDDQLLNISEAYLIRPINNTRNISTKDFVDICLALRGIGMEIEPIIAAIKEGKLPILMGIVKAGMKVDKGIADYIFKTIVASPISGTAIERLVDTLQDPNFIAYLRNLESIGITIDASVIKELSNEIMYKLEELYWNQYRTGIKQDFNSELENDKCLQNKVALVNIAKTMVGNNPNLTIVRIIRFASENSLRNPGFIRELKTWAANNPGKTIEDKDINAIEKMLNRNDADEIFDGN